MKLHIYNNIVVALTAVSMSLVLAPAAWAQSEQKVQVMEYNGKSGKTPLAQVAVTVLNATSTMTGDDGVASLRFRTLHNGDQVKVRRIEKAGYEVFNSQALEQWTVSDQRTFQIVLCRSDKFRALRDQYSRVASESYERQYKAEQARLAAERKKTRMLEETYQQKLTELENQYQQQLEDLDNYVDQFARIDLSELSNQQQELVNLVKAGKIDKAIAKYESVDYQAQYEQQCRDIAQIDRAQAQLALVEAQKRSEREKVYQAIGRQIATYRLAGGRDNFRKVTELLKSVADADTTCLDAVWEYAKHAQKQNLVDDCQRYFLIYIRGCQDKPALVSDAYSAIGLQYMLRSEYDKAEAAFSKALQLMQPLYEQNPEIYATYLLWQKYQMATIYLWTERIEPAVGMLNGAISECEARYATDAESFADILALLLAANSQALVLTGDVDNAIASGRRACDITRALYKEEEELAQQYIVALNNLIVVYNECEQWQNLITTEQELIAVLDDLYSKNPEAYLQDISCAYNNLADTQVQMHDLDGAERSFTKAEDFLRMLCEQDPASRQYDRFALNEIGARLYLLKGDAAKAATYRDAALEAYSQLQPIEQQQFTTEAENLRTMF